MAGVGDQPFIKHPSVIKFADARFANDVELLSEIAQRNALRRERCSERLLKLVQEGLLASPFTPRKIFRYCQEFGTPSAGNQRPPTNP